MRVGAGMGIDYEAGVIMETGEWVEKLYRRELELGRQIAAGATSERDALKGRLEAVKTLLRGVLRVTALQANGTDEIRLTVDERIDRMNRLGIANGSPSVKGDEP